jgi:hypothetical protein
MGQVSDTPKGVAAHRGAAPLADAGIYIPEPDRAAMSLRRKSSRIDA